MNRLHRNPREKVKTGFWLLNPASKFESLLLTLFFLLLPTQLGKHFWPDFSIVSGIRIDYLSPIVYVTDVLLILLFGSVVYRWFKTQKKLKVKSQKLKIQIKSKKFLLTISLLLFFFANILFSPRPLLSFYGFVKLCEYFFLGFYLAKTIHYAFQLQKIALLFSISAIFESLLAIFQYLNQGSLNGIFYFLGERTFTGATPGIANASINGTLILRPYATFSHPNVLSGYLLVAMVLVWSFLLTSQVSWKRVFAVVTLLISSVALLLTYSRVAILLWIVLVFIQLFRLGKRRIKTAKVQGVLFVIAVVVLLLLSNLSLTHELFYRFVHTSLTDESIVERTELLAASWIMILQHPIIGVGLLNFIPSLAPLQKPLPLNLYLQPVHNIFVLIAVETGIVGFGLFVWLLALTFLRIKNYKVRIRGTFFALFLSLRLAYFS